LKKQIRREIRRREGEREERGKKGDIFPLHNVEVLLLLTPVNCKPTPVR
jgi:hypothetical protein